MDTKLTRREETLLWEIQCEVCSPGSDPRNHFLTPVKVSKRKLSTARKLAAKHVIKFDPSTMEASLTGYDPRYSEREKDLESALSHALCLLAGGNRKLNQTWMNYHIDRACIGRPLFASITEAPQNNVPRFRK